MALTEGGEWSYQGAITLLRDDRSHVRKDQADALVRIELIAER
jgi:hypothetical protein